MTEKMKKNLIKVIISIAIYIATAVLVKLNYIEGNLELALYLAAYLIVGAQVLKRAVRNIIGGQVFDENFLMAIATVGAFLVGEYPEAVAVMLFYQIGELFEKYAVNRSRKSISDLMDIYPEYANVVRAGKLETVDPEEVNVGEVILIRPGERVPLDGEVIKGTSNLDTRALTGETQPREVFPGEAVVSGCINLNGVIEVKVSREFGESTVSKILELVENASSHKAEAENFITKFARYYTPVVVISAALLALIPPLIIPGASWADWVYRALTFLVISCPCALVISIPLSFFGGLGGASRRGILVKGSNYLEALANVEIAVFDKTGTLTKGNFKVSGIFPAESVITGNAELKESVSGEMKAEAEERLIRMAAHAEIHSSHPIAASIRDAYGKAIDAEGMDEIEELSGYGVKALIDGKTVYAGSRKLMNDLGIRIENEAAAGTLVHIAEDGKYAGYILVEDEIKYDSQRAVKELMAMGIKKIVMLTGDRKNIGESVGKKLGITEIYTELLPADKVEKMVGLMKQKSPKGKLIFVGDGINDAPVLAGADIGIAMGGLGSDAAIEAADIVIMTDEPSKVAEAIKISKKTLRIVKQNIVFALGIKLFVLLLAAFGAASMWAAVFADVGVSVLAILNAIRLIGGRSR
ncbi:heavy metal translocating P-type ATPase [Anaerobium acetethylicum]|uniref:Cd(2+)-exporting ATPase n=1 Tax=Anaerobium acetethylicum TaxID=1619234 RepID=A0A1D3TVW5_9FIRM|nr:heavy metal translocating P-type ATPase [Anaerobium acetethylicum]SCP98327.1 Cd2+/Zn2+-exporting ATPase [Anaerobium acetethylicum]